MNNVTISGCIITKNKAYQGYAIYIEGENCETTFTIGGNNQFIDNSGTQQHPESGGVIASEILNIDKENIEKYNQFSDISSRNVVKFILVDHSGNPLPDPTDSPTPSLSPVETPSQSPTESPSQSPIETPSQSPTESPSQSPTESPSQSQTESPSQSPTESPSQSPAETQYLYNGDIYEHTIGGENNKFNNVMFDCPPQEGSIQFYSVCTSCNKVQPTQKLWFKVYFKEENIENIEYQDIVIHDDTHMSRFAPSEHISYNQDSKTLIFKLDSVNMKVVETKSELKCHVPPRTPKATISQSPSQSLTESPSQSPTESPSQSPTESPSQSPVETPSQSFTPEPTPERSTVPGTLADYINQQFIEIPSGPSVADDPEKGRQIQAGGSTEVKQISGCTFTDISNSKRAYYIMASSEILFFDNVFKNTQYSTNEGAGIMWINYNNGKMTITNCKFTNLVSRGQDGHIFNVNSGSKIQLILERCEFTDCGKSDDRALINMLQNECSIEMYDCNIIFNNIENSCRVIDLRSHMGTFERCHFTQCGEKAIYLGYTNNDLPDISPYGTLIFKNNFIDQCNKGKFIYAPQLSNHFDSITLGDNYMISITYSQNEIEFNNNTFSSIKTSSYCGGVGISIINSNSEFTIKYTNCIFKNNEALNSHGGSICYGYSSNNNNANIDVVDCEFENNAVTGGHGAGIAIRTSKSINIENCKFSNNNANRQNDSTGSKGFGGGIYISTSFDSNGAQCTNSVAIKRCRFLENQAYQGYGIHIQGNRGTFEPTLTISYNNFDNNHGTEAPPKRGGIITTEITSFTEDNIESNTFNNDAANTEHFIHVDNLGIPLPEPSGTPRPTETPPPDQIIFMPGDISEGDRIDKPNNNPEVNYSTVIVNVTDFIDIKHDGDFGGAIHVTNYGLKCDNIKFHNCSSYIAGGGIYLKNTKEINLEVNFEGLNFDECSANYGGAIYIYCDNSKKRVKIVSCIFTNNEARVTDTSSPMYGGSSIFLTARKSKVHQCTFDHNKGESDVKLYNVFDQPSSRSRKGLSMNNDDDELVQIKDCKFITKSKITSLFYVQGNNEVPYQVMDCIFSGKLTGGAHYIDGKSINKNGHKLVVKNCKFDDNDDKHMKIIQNDFNIILTDTLKNNNDENNSFNSFIPITLAAVLAVAILVSALFVIILRKNNKVQEEEDPEYQSSSDNEL